MSASKEFLDALFDKHNIDGEQISSKSVVDKEFRQTLGSPQNNQLVEAISHAIVSHADQQRSDADAPFGSARAQRLLPPRGAPGGSGRVGLRRWRGRATGRPATAASGARARRLPKSPNAPMRFAVQAHSCIGSHGTEHGWFDERQHPLTEGAPPPQPSLAAVQGWLWTILDALKLDPECLILSLVLILILRHVLTPILIRILILVLGLIRFILSFILIVFAPHVVSSRSSVAPGIG